MDKRISRDRHTSKIKDRSACVVVGVAGLSQLWLSECIPELINSSSLKSRTKRAVWHFVRQVLSRKPLPPLVVCDVYVHRSEDDTDSCK